MKKTNSTFAKIWGTMLRRHSSKKPLSLVVTLAMMLVGHFAFGQIMDPCPPGSGNMVTNCPPTNPAPIPVGSNCQAVVPEFKFGADGVMGGVGPNADVSGTAGAGYFFVGVVQAPMSGTLFPAGTGNKTVQVGAAFLNQVPGDPMFGMLCAEVCPDIIQNVFDNTNPTIACGSPQLYADANCQVVLTQAVILDQILVGLSDNCTDSADITITFSPAGPLAGPSCPTDPNPVIRMVTVTAQDASGNMNSCIANVGVADTLGPAATFAPFANGTYSDTIPAINIGNINCGNLTPDLTGLVTVGPDNCGGAVNIFQAPSAGTPYTLNMDPVTGCVLEKVQQIFVTVEDCYNNDSTHIYTIHIQDQTPPTITSNCGDVPPQATLVTDGNCMVNVPDLTGFMTSTDNCLGPQTWIQSPIGLTDVSGICPPNNTISVTFTAVDCFGNQSTPLTCPALLTFTDNTPPSIVCPPNPITVVVPFNGATCQTDMAIIDLAFLTANGVTVTDACDPNPVLSNLDPMMFTCADINKANLFINIGATDCFANVGSGSCAVSVVADIDLTADWSIGGGDFIVCPNEFPLCIELGPNTPSCGVWSGDITVSASASCASGVQIQASAFPDLDNDGVPDPGSYSVTYTVGPPGCHVQETHNIMVSPQFNAADAALIADTTICMEATEIFDLEGLLAPGSIQGGSFDTIIFSGAATGQRIGNLFQYLGGDGNVTVIYSLTDCDNAVEADTVVISIDEKPDGHFTMAAVMCQDQGLEIPNITGVPTGASLLFTSMPAGFITNASTGVFDPTAGPLSQEFVDVTVTMRVTNGVCDTFYISQIVRVHESGNPAFVLQDTICESSPPINLSLTNPLNDGGANPVTAANVTWSGISVTDLGFTGSFDPSVGPGIYNVCVTVGAPSCEETQCHQIVVAKDYTPAEVALVDDFSLCMLPDQIISFDALRAGPQPMTGSGTYVVTEQGGLNGVGTINANNYVYHGECGTLTVIQYYAYDCVPTSDTVVITIEQKPDVGGLAVPGPLCAQDGPAFIEYSGTPVVCGTPGVFSAPNSPAGTITDLGTGTTAVFNPVAAGEGLHIIQYEIGNPNSGCYSIVFAEIEVRASSNPEFPLPSTACANEPVNLALGSADPSVLPSSPDGITEIYWFGGDGLNAVVTNNGDGTGTFVGYHTGTYTVCVQTGDLGCNQYRCHQITVDNVPPVLNCAPLVRVRSNSLDSCNYTMPGIGFDVTATDNCSPPNGPGSIILSHNYPVSAGHAVSANTLMGATFPVGITHVIWTATDTAGNSSNCTIEIVIEDNESPTVTFCPSNTTIGTDADICGAQLNYALPQFEDNCDGPNLEGVLVAGYAPGADFPVGTTTVTWEYTDLADNTTATCSFTVTVNDDDMPTPVCSPDYAVALDGDGEFTILSTDIDNGSYDNCQIATRYISRTGGAPWSGSVDVSCADVLSGPVVVSLQVVDLAGNSSICTTNVTVNDEQVPDIECPGYLTVHADAGVCAAVVNYPAPTVTDNCSFTVEQVATITGTMNGGFEVPPTSSLGTGTLSGTVSVSSGSFNLNVAFSGLGSNVVAAHIHNAPAGSNGGVIIDLVGLGFPTGVTAGTFSTNISLTPAQVTELLAGNLYVNIHTTGNPGGEIRGQLLVANNSNLTSGDVFPVGTSVQTYQVTDIGGNTETCSFSILVYDEVAPTINCGPSVRTHTADPGVCSFTMPGTGFDAVGADNCGAVTITHNYPFAVDPNTLAGTSFPVGSTTVTWIATDVSGNQSAICGIEIIITDDEDPTINCNSGAPANVLANPSFEAGGPFDSQITDNWTNFGPAFRLFASVSPPFFTHDGNVMLKTFGGAAGVFQDFPVTVGDQLNGSAWIRNASFDPIGPNQFAVVKFEFLDAANTVLSFVESPQFTAANLPTDVWTQATVSATVPAGTVNARFVVVSVTLSGGGAVMFDDASVTIGTGGISGNVIVDNDPGVCGADLDINNPMADDNCGIVSIINNYNYTSNASGFYPVGTTIVGFTVTDASGNTADCSITVTVNDTEAPTFVNCPTTMVMIGNDPDQCSGKLNWSIPVATDNCELASVTQTGGPANGTPVPVGMPMTVTYTATDIYGNSSTCVFDVQVVDTQNPEFDADIVMPGNITVQCNAVPPAFVLTTDDVHDNCTPSNLLVITFTQTSTQGTDPNNCTYYNYTITRTWKVTDQAGNMLVHTQVITVQDTQAPTPVCQNATITLNKSGVASFPPDSLAVGTTDNCAPFSALTITGNPTTFTCANIGPNNVTLTISDPCGNTATCAIVVTVNQGIGSCAPGATLASSCLNNATTLTNGQFAELITISGLAMQTWTITTSNGLYTNASANPPAAPTPVSNGTAFTMGTADGIDNDGDGQIDEADEMIFYTLKTKYVEAIGYTATATNNLGQTVTLSNVGHYPTPVISGGPFGPFCLSTPAFVPTVVDQYAGANAYVSVTFLVDGVPVAQVDPSTLSVGQHTLTVIVDGGSAAFSRKINGILVPGDAANSNDARLDPGCIQSITQFFQVVTTPSQVVCNDLLHVTLDPVTCSSVILPDDVLEGTYACFDDYSVNIYLPNGVPLNPHNVVTGAHVGINLSYTLVHPVSGNTCWGHILVEDKSSPVAICPNDVEILCTVDPDSVVYWVPFNHPCYPAKDYWGNLVPVNDSLLYLGEPSATDCSPWVWPFAYTDDYTLYECTDNPALIANITRTFIIQDIWGNKDTCQQHITWVRGEANQVTWPADTVIACNYPYLDQLAASNYSADSLGWPYIFSYKHGKLSLAGNGICNLGLTVSDQIVNVCTNEYKVVRTWTLFDWCPANGGPPTQTVHVQYIKIENVAPIITVDCLQTDPATGYCVMNATEPGNYPHYPCYAIFVPYAQVDAVCDQIVDITVETPGGGTTNGGIIPGGGLPLGGPYVITYRAEDQCGHITELELTVIVKDLTAPVAVCDEITDVNLSSDGLATVYASTFDDGSYDGCCLDHFEVRKMDGDPCGLGGQNFGPSVTFCCADIANSPVTVVFRAFDCNGNYNDCMVSVNVNDKSAPIRTFCPPDKRITCDWYADNLETQLQGLTGAQQCAYLTNAGFGEATFQDNCPVTVSCNTTINLDQCLEGVITRTFSAVDASGNAASQNCTTRIFVDHVSDWVVEFPADITVNCGTTTPDFGEPEIFYETCELVAVSYEDQLFNVVQGACYKLLRTWKVINWCVVGNNIDEEVVEQPENQLGLVFPLCDLDGDGDCDARTFRDSWNSASKPGAGQATQTTNPDTDLDSDPWDGYITYQQTIKVIDNVDPVFVDCTIDTVCIEDNSCTVGLQLPIPVVDECSHVVTISAQIKFNGVYQNAGSVVIKAGVTTDAFTVFPNVGPGTYDVKYIAMDNCNNQSACETKVTVKDCKNPTPYCKDGLVIELMQTGMVQTWASDFNAGSFDNCPGTLRFSFSSNPVDSGEVYTCDSVGLRTVRIYVTDAAGNQDFCITQVEIQANQNQCDDTLSVHIGGLIETEDNEGVADVNVQLSGTSQNSMMTDNNGMFNFAVVPGGDYSITPVKDDNPLNGVTTFDLVLISKHILGIQALNSPYKLIAADANKSGTVTTFDLVTIRKVILFIDTEFLNNTSWRFVDKDFVFPNPQNPWQTVFPEVINVNNITANQLAADFVAVKIGDVNSSAVPNFAAGNEDRSTHGKLVFTVDDVQMNPGQEYTVAFKASDFKVLGYQFTLNFDKGALDFADVIPGVAGTENFGLALLENGAITASWNDNNANVADGQTVFSLVFKATTAARLSDVLSVNSRYTKAEAYKRNGDLLDVELVFNGAAATRNFELYQNTPNPFTNYTVIGFNLPEAVAATLTVTDVSGKVVKSVKQEFAKGFNEIRLERRELPATGILYYQLDTPTDSATKMMLLMD
ncbi:MAG: HYR domain-containing protein [Lewinellaceae bacterium]|nr:HYR domain-containing protein [Lewinellaceae bacterium]